MIFDKLEELYDKAKEFRMDHPALCTIADTAVIIAGFTVGLCIYGTKRVKKLVGDENAIRDMIGYNNVLSLLEDTAVDIFDITNVNGDYLGHAVIGAGALREAGNAIVKLTKSDGSDSFKAIEITNQLNS